MSDLIQRLRDVPDSKLSAYAADELERLQARLADKEKLLADAVTYGTDYKQSYDVAMANYQAVLARLAEVCNLASDRFDEIVRLRALLADVYEHYIDDHDNGLIAKRVRATLAARHE